MNSWWWNSNWRQCTTSQEFPASSKTIESDRVRKCRTGEEKNFFYYNTQPTAEKSVYRACHPQLLPTGRKQWGIWWVSQKAKDERNCFVLEHTAHYREIRLPCLSHKAVKTACCLHPASSSECELPPHSFFCKMLKKSMVSILASEHHLSPTSKNLAYSTKETTNNARLYRVLVDTGTQAPQR